MRPSSKVCILILFIAGLSSSCQQRTPGPTPARTYFSQAFDSIEKYSLRRNEVNLDSIERHYFRQLHDTMPLKYAYHYLREASMTIDPHSDFYRPSIAREKGHRPDPLYTFRGRMLEDRYAYLDIQGCQALDSASCKDYADSLALLTMTLYEMNPMGWIIDLRGNTGGNMYPMIAGLSPLLGEGILGFNVYLDGTKEAWFAALRNTESGQMDSLGLMDSVHVFIERRPIVVLIGAGTGSAGEALTLSFRSAPRVQIIGEPTYGLATGNRLVFLSDSAALNITDSYMADRNGVYVEDRISPDIAEFDAIKVFDKAYLFIAENGIRD